jgi:hypothetical protein
MTRDWSRRGDPSGRAERLRQEIVVLRIKGDKAASSIGRIFVRSLGMDRRRPASGWRAATFAAALFAITLNFLQPLAHAALMRDGGPMAVSLWTSMCSSSAGQDDDQDSLPAAGKMHECCLGLAHAPTLAAPSDSFLPAPRIAIAVDRAPVALDALAPVGIRDGPNQPRAPPSLA